MVNEVQVRFRDEATVEQVTLNDLCLELPTQRKFKDSGQMIAPATIARVGIMEYRAGECGAMFKDRDPNSIVKIMTEAVDLFDAESLESYRSAPITIEHPAEDVDVENSKELMKGHLEGMPFADADGEHLSGTIVLHDGEAIDLVETGVSHLSSGHTCTLVLGDESVEWDAKKTKIRANHIAIVRRGRAGSATIADAALDVPTLSVEEIAKLHDVEVSQIQSQLEMGIKVELEHSTDRTVAEEIALDHLKESPDYYSKLNEMEESFGDEDTTKMFDQAFVDSLQAKLDAKTDQLDITTQKLADAEAKLADEAYINERVTQRLEFLNTAAQFTDADLVGLSEVDAMRQVLKDTYGKDFTDVPDAKVEMRYEILLEDGADSGTSISQALKDNAIAGKNAFVEETPEAKPTKAQEARDRMIARNSK
ncbi:DUF2213 domain-containing protein [Vibrio phage vB_VpaM_VPs20]|uniref:DUF2213 domain-containing protein n=1 Tax=Vibrio phage vB_VpaM_VPs20 TaxID=2978980 RepID=A0A9X9JPN0_9CAUD|nr:DUF2213 domain-containing protein [Vibrio phage vB_VpaM_VPs20]UYD72114.1 DUF2213 domain-containing protein [Vibrio phage vB_VpaM_VPs20]